jgi:hypothetical protein
MVSSTKVDILWIQKEQIAGKNDHVKQKYRGHFASVRALSFNILCKEKPSKQKQKTYLQRNQRNGLFLVG